MKDLSRFLTTLLLAPLAALHAAGPTTPRVAPDATFSQIAQSSGFTPEMPKLSDVCMRLFALNQPGITAKMMLAAGSDKVTDWEKVRRMAEGKLEDEVGSEMKG